MVPNKPSPKRTRSKPTQEGKTKEVSRPARIPKKRIITSQESNLKMVIPVIAEEAHITKREKSETVRFTKQVQHDQRSIPLEGYTEEIVIERVPCNEILQEPAVQRQEGDTTIIPVMEEIEVVEKRLVLKEEVRITKRRRKVSRTGQVTLRSEEVIVERVSPETQRDRSLKTIKGA